MSQLKTLRTSLLAVATAVTLCATAAQAGFAATPAKAPAAPAASGLPAAFDAGRPGPSAANPHDEVERLATAPKQYAALAKGPREAAPGKVPGVQGTAAKAKFSAPARTLAGVPCTLDGIRGLSPEGLADFLADPAVTANGCLRSIVWTWDQRLAPVMSDAHVQAVSRRISSLAASHDGKNGTHLVEMFTYLHAVIFHDFTRGEIDVTDAPTVDAMRQAIEAFGNAARTFDATDTNAEALREALIAGSAPGLRQYQLPLIKRVLSTMDAAHPATNASKAWGDATWAALTTTYLGIYSGNRDAAFHAAVKADASFRDAFKAFGGYTHLKGKTNEWAVRDATLEYGRFGEVEGLRSEIVTGLGALLSTTAANFGEGSASWAKAATWLNDFGACKQYNICKEDIERRLFPNTFTYDNGGIKVRTGLDRATVDQLYYASKQVKAQYHRVLGSEAPLADDPNDSLNTVLYASRKDYEIYHPLLTGMETDNGGIYIEKGATFYTYQRRVPQDSMLTLEELFRHEYVHYLNGRWAIHGSYGKGAWYENDRTTAMEEGTAEFFDGATRDDGIKVRKSLVAKIIDDTAGGRSRMTVNQLLHATFPGDGFRLYPYAGTFFEFLWLERPAMLTSMYGYLRANDVAGFDAWRNRVGNDPGTQAAYDRFLDKQIAIVNDLYVPVTTHVPFDQLSASTPAQIKSSFAATTSNSPDCKTNGDTERPRFVCNGRITANLGNSGDPDQVFKDMSETVDYFILDRSKSGVNNFNDMNCTFGKVDVWTGGRAGTSSFTCEGPLKRG
ncbi:collagenase [Streptomyces sp. NPDC050504]|uniref:collagenase n=1 Tax=Streptomyces sp. NPDC050504 TaxID=3365618 RepID=UPI00378E5B0C